MKEEKQETLKHKESQLKEKTTAGNQQQEGKEERKEKQEKKEKESSESKAEKELIEARKKLEEYTDMLKRLQAEFENYKKRVDKEQLIFNEFINAKIITDFLPLLDSFEQALTQIEKAEKFSKEDALNGTKLLFKQLIKTMKEHGLQEIKSTEEKFNPEKHEALMQANEKEKPDQLILEEFQKGYLLKGKVLRHAKVKVNKAEEKGVEEK
ncbi:MAG TPA: nucleotide exchange factor GrpE [archaeon]|nr:nucleotide exchange factor GrpE [archaeon]